MNVFSKSATSLVLLAFGLVSYAQYGSSTEQYTDVGTVTSWSYAIDSTTVRREGSNVRYTLIGKYVGSYGSDATLSLTAEVGVNCNARTRIEYVTNVTRNGNTKTTTAFSPEMKSVGGTAKDSRELDMACQIATSGSGMKAILTGPVMSTSGKPTLSIPLLHEGGTFTVPVHINGAITLNFVVDSGASDVSIPSDVVTTLIRTGTIRKTDFLGQKIYVLADGAKVPSQTFRIRSMKVGDRIVENVTGSVASTEGMLLLGQSFLGRFKSWSIDNTQQVLLLE